MQETSLLVKILPVMAMLCFPAMVCAQGTGSAKTIPLTDSSKTATSTVNPDATEKKNKKMVKDATINLQTTVTGNQEQPRVLYILPWQSPATDDVDFESLDSQHKAVFSHIEREELRRELEAAGK